MGCWAHARRKFFEASEAYKKVKKDDRKSSADEALDFISEIYRIEKEIRLNGLKKSAVIEKRKSETVPVLESFKTWLDKLRDEIVPGSYLGKAINYTLGQWERLKNFIDLDIVTPDNNLVENAIRPFVMGKKTGSSLILPKEPIPMRPYTASLKPQKEMIWNPGFTRNSFWQNCPSLLPVMILNN